MFQKVFFDRKREHSNLWYIVPQYKLLHVFAFWCTSEFIVLYLVSQNNANENFLFCVSFLFAHVWIARVAYQNYFLLIYLPTLISKFLNLSGQPHSAPLLTMYTSDTCSTCCRSTLHQGFTLLDLTVIVHDPSGLPYCKWVLLFPSTALLLLPSLYCPLYWYVGLPNARLSWKKGKKKEIWSIN